MPELNNHERHLSSRAQMLRLSSFNKPEIMAQAVLATRDAMEKLKPYEPLNLEDLLDELGAIPVNTGGRSMVGALETLIDSWSLDRKRCELIIKEWCL